MIHMTVGVFGNAEYAKRLGKQGTVNDIAIYNHGSSEGVFTYVTVASEKIQSLLQVINMIDVPVVVVSEMNATLGEQLIALSEFGFNHGFFILEGVHEDQIKPIIRGTCLEKFLFIEEKQLAEELRKLKIERHGDLHVPIDNYFNVKSVGTVILGIVKSGTVRKYDKVIVEPPGTEVTVKGIQSQDRDIESAEAGTRVGLNLKGIEADDLKRGYLIGKCTKATRLRMNFVKSRYSKETIKDNDPLLVCSGLLVMAGKVVKTDPMEIEFETPMIYQHNTRFLLATTKQNMPRIIGHATLIS